MGAIISDLKIQIIIWIDNRSILSRLFFQNFRLGWFLSKNIFFQEIVEIVDAFE